MPGLDLLRTMAVSLLSERPRPGTRASRRLASLAGPASRAALAAGLLVACSRTPGPRTLAERVAPELVWDTTDAPLSSLLRSPEAGVVISFGEENLRCTLHQEPGEVVLDCGAIEQRAASFDALAREVNAGAMHRALSSRRLLDPTLFKEITQISLETPWAPRTDAGAPAQSTPAQSGLAKLAEPYGEVTFTVGERGEVVASLAGLDHEISLRAGGVWGLGYALRQAQDEIREERAVFRISQGLKPLLAPLRVPPAAAGYGAQSLGAPVVTSPREEQIKQRGPGGVLMNVDVAALGDRVIRIDREFIFDAPSPPIDDCGLLSPRVEALLPGGRAEHQGHRCLWSFAEQGGELTLSYARGRLLLSYALSVGRRMQLPR